MNIENIYSMRDSSNDEMYFEIGVFLSVDAAMEVIHKYEESGEAMTETGIDSDESETVTLHKVKLGFTGVDASVEIYRIDREQVYVEKDDKYIWRRVP